MKLVFKVATAAVLALSAQLTLASTLTEFSPAGTNVTAAGASSIGGIVIDLKGLNGASTISQVAASTLFQGFYSNNPGNIGTQTGYTSSVISSLGGGLLSASFRFTLYDGDSAAGDFDDGDNQLLVNGIDVGSWSDVTTETTTSLGTVIGAAHDGFANEQLDTGWFHLTDVTKLNSLFASLSTGSILFQVSDVDAGDNFYDFTQGIDKSLINVGSGPVVVPPPSSVPVPAALPLLASALGLFGFAKRRKSA
jgi:hypothetical protein